MTYSLLSGVRVLELSLLAPDLLGMHLADLGAEVIKVEQPPRGDYVREIGGNHVGGISLMHLRWNRGKRSLALDLKRPEGRKLLHELVAKAHVVIDGLRMGAAQRCGAGYDELRALNPALVYCSLSGTGRTGPYVKLATHGVAYDAFAGLAPPVQSDDGAPRVPIYTTVGMQAAPLYAAMAVCAALVRARESGQGCWIDIAELDGAVAWQAERLGGVPGVAASGPPDFGPSVRYQYYATADDRFILFQATERKFWRNFCGAVGRMDLFDTKPGADVGDHARGDEALRTELAAIFRTRTQADWVTLFIDANVAGGPVHSVDELPDDPHVKARELLTEQPHPVAPNLRLFTTPVRIAGEHFGASPAPTVGEHTVEILADVLGRSSDEVARLRRDGVV